MRSRILQALWVIERSLILLIGDRFEVDIKINIL
jgi:hypothetical protein